MEKTLHLDSANFATVNLFELSEDDGPMAKGMMAESVITDIEDLSSENQEVCLSWKMLW